MKEVRIFALGHNIIDINKEAIKMDVANPDSPASYGSVAHNGCSILVNKVKDTKLKIELEKLQNNLQNQYGSSIIMAYVN